MITTELLEKMLRFERTRFHHFKESERNVLQYFYDGKIETLDELIAISKEVDNERKYTRDNVCESRQN